MEQRDTNVLISAIWSRPNLAKPDLAILIWPHLAKPTLASPHLANFFLWWGGGWGSRRGGGPNLEKVGPRRWGPEGGPEGVGARTQKRWGPKGLGPRRVGAQNFALFFSLSRRKFHSFFSLGGLLVEFWWCFEAPGRSNVHVWRAQTCTHLRVPAFKNHQNSTRRPPRERRKNEISGGGEKKKSEILGGPAEGAVQRRGPKNLEDTHHTHQTS